MTVADQRAYDTDILVARSRNVMVGDGATGTRLQAHPGTGRGVAATDSFGCDLVAMTTTTLQVYGGAVARD